MATTFIIYNTAGQPVSAIQPNTLDGPEGVQQNSDLRMYGLGYPNWGEGVNENDYHIVESFACPPLSSFPSSARYALLGPTVSAITPAGQASDELGSGNGINVPLVGQLWFNTVQNKLYVNTAASPNPAWTTVGAQAVAVGSMPLTPILGDLWYDSSVPQLKIYNGTSFVSVAALYLPLAGGTMTGTLNMSSATIAMGGNKITGLATGTSSTDAVNVAQMNSAISGAGALFLPTAGGTMTGLLAINAGINVNGGNLTVNGTSALNVTSNQPINYTGSNSIAFDAGTKRIANVANPSVTTDALNLAYANLQYLSLLSGGTVGGPSTFNSSIRTGTAPSIGNDITNKTYVDSAISTAIASAIGSGVLSGNGYWTFPGGLMIQWGTAFYAAFAGVDIFFPTPFPNACFSVTNTSPGSANYGYPTASQIINRFHFVVNGAGNGTSSSTIYWMAIGF